MKLNDQKSNVIAILLVLITGTFGVAEAQKGTMEMKNLVRNVSVAFPDSTIKAVALDVNPKVKIDNTTPYYWYYNNQINHNIGGYYGRLLHGAYRVFNKNNQMITEGNFSNGIKIGLWKYWFANGSLKASALYKNGKLNGDVVYFSMSGEKIRVVEYNNGVMDGSETIFRTDTTIVNKYNKGRLIEKKKKRAKPDKPAKAVVKDTIPSMNPGFIEMENKTPVDTLTKPKPNVFKRMFKKKKTANA